MDNCTFLGNCPPTHPLGQHQHSLLTCKDTILAYGRGRWAVSQKSLMIRIYLVHQHGRRTLPPHILPLPARLRLMNYKDEVSFYFVRT